MSATALTAGTARVTTTPPLGIRLAGGLREGPSTEVHQDLTLTALVLADDDAKIVLLACDLIILSPLDARHIREQVARRLDIPWTHVLLNVSHSHATPSPPSWGEYEYEATDDEVQEVHVYFDYLARQAASAAYTADLARVPARTAVGTGYCDVNVNRRERLEDGTMVLGENPSGPVDREVGVIRIDDLEGYPVAMVLNYACHPDVLGPKASVISPDFLGSARQTAEAITGATTLFLQGAAGDIYPCTGIVQPPDGVDAADRIGRQLGCEAGRVFEQLNTNRQRGRRLVWQSASTLTTWEYEDTPPTLGSQLAVVNETLSLPLQPLPSLEEAQQTLATNELDLSKVLEDPISQLSDKLVAHRRVIWAQRQLQAVRDDAPPELPVEIQMVRIGEAILAAIPGELFTEIGQAIKRLSSSASIFVCAYSNGVYFYIPTAEAFEEGGYEPNAHRNYVRPSGPTQDWEELLVNACSRILPSALSGLEDRKYATG